MNFKSGIYFKNKDLTYNPESFNARPVRTDRVGETWEEVKGNIKIAGRTM
jgi:hypothetical protein